jgi:hypothetical protein
LYIYFIFSACFAMKSCKKCTYWLYCVWLAINQSTCNSLRTMNGFVYIEYWGVLLKMCAFQFWLEFETLDILHELLKTTILNYVHHFSLL